MSLKEMMKCKISVLVYLTVFFAGITDPCFSQKKNDIRGVWILQKESLHVIEFGNDSIYNYYKLDQQSNPVTSVPWKMEGDKLFIGGELRPVKRLTRDSLIFENPVKEAFIKVNNPSSSVSVNDIKNYLSNAKIKLSPANDLMAEITFQSDGNGRVDGDMMDFKWKVIDIKGTKLLFLEGVDLFVVNSLNNGQLSLESYYFFRLWSTNKNVSFIK